MSQTEVLILTIGLTAITFLGVRVLDYVLAGGERRAARRRNMARPASRIDR